MTVEVLKNLLTGQSKLNLEQKFLPSYLMQCRWFSGKSRDIQTVFILDQVIAPHNQAWALLFLNVQYFEGAAETYLLPLAYATGKEAESIRSIAPRAILVDLASEPGSKTDSDIDSETGGILFEAIHHSGFRSEIMQLIASGGNLPGQRGLLSGHSMPGHFGIQTEESFSLSHVLKAEQSNTSLIYPEGYFVKILRRLEEEMNPELEILRFLDEETQFRNAPSLFGWLEYTFGSKQTYTLGIVEGLIPFETDAWNYALTIAKSHLDQYRQGPSGTASISKIGIEFANLLGQRTAEMHLALSSRSDYLDFQPEAFSMEYQRNLGESIRIHIDGVYKNLARVLPQLQDEAKILAQKVWDEQDKVLETLACLDQELFATVRIRIHGDYHLGQVLFTGSDVMILDFEGEPSRSLKYRKQKRSPWCDVAGMLRSFHYAIHSARLEGIGQDLEAWVELWPEQMTTAFLEAYLKAAGDAPFILKEQQRRALLRLYLMEKAIYELDYELNNRPTWVHIPLRGILRLLHP
jgi:maltose alpha-D-glucosyltransferase / alpha-amylase